MLNVTIDQFNQAKSKDVIEMVCDNCNQKYTREKFRVVWGIRRQGVLNFDARTFCSKDCQTDFQKSDIQITIHCGNCGNITTNKKYCSRKCSSIVNNRIHKKRVATPRFCTRCNSPSKYPNKLCTDCIDEGYSNSNNGKLVNQTIRQTFGKYANTSNRFNTIRGHAKRVLPSTNGTCTVCGYNKHVEVCHIKAIKDFPEDALVSEVNKRENLVLLCPNCHWEFDSGMLKMPLSKPS